jgi:hypothetical protein
VNLGNRVRIDNRLNKESNRSDRGRSSKVRMSIILLVAVRAGVEGEPRATGTSVKSMRDIVEIAEYWHKTLF